MSDVVMPRLSDTMEEGTILRWLKHDGEHVGRGEELVEIETDKASMTYESDREGTLRTLAREGDTLAVGEPIARIGEQAPGDSETPFPQSTPSAVGVEEPMVAAAPNATPNGTPQRPAEHAGLPEPAERGGGRVKASPLARRVARERGVDLAELSGSGPGGRIVKADVEAQAESVEARADSVETRADSVEMRAESVETRAESIPVASATPIERAAAPTTVTAPVSAPTVAPAPTPTAPPTDVPAAKGETSAIELSRTQRTIARRMAESKATIPDFTLTADVDMEGCVELRAELKRLSHDEAPTYNDMIVKACALALREHPRANGGYRDGRFELHSRVNVGVAVAVAAEDPTAGALVVPTVFDADAKALGEIARETRELAARVRDGQITPPELSGATFTVSNLGMYGIRQFTAIVNPPQAAILAVGEVAPRAVPRKKKIVARQSMAVTLTCDHRILYGADAALFLARVRELLEEPTALTL